ncbi:sporulation initiation factor Spo0A C-terminal domain-containing protein [Anaerotignum sp.]
MKGNEKSKVILADRDGFYLQRLKRCLERKGDMTVMGMTDSGPAVLEMAKQGKPDVILMDILLGERDGFWVLENLKKEGISCICILISAIDSDKLVRQAIILGADYYMAKPIQGDLLMERIHQLLRQESGEKAQGAKKEKEPEIAENPFRNLEGEISVMLSRMGISASIRGYHFIRKAVLMAVEDQDVLVGITKGLYPDIAKMYKTSASKVERAIRHAIESAWKKNGPQVYFEAAGYLPAEKPTNGQFIAALSEFFRIQGEERPKKIG